MNKDRKILHRESILLYNFDKEELYNNYYSNRLCKSIFNLDYDYNINNNKLIYNTNTLLIKPFKNLNIKEDNELDNYYLNILCWNKRNIISFGQENTCFYWKYENYCNNNNSDNLNNKLQKIYINKEEGNITNISSSNEGKYIAIATEKGIISIWDIEKKIKLRVLKNEYQLNQIGVSDWNNYILSTGSFNGTIINRDIRIKDSIISILNSNYHNEDSICSLKWNKDGTKLASGGNDNLLNIWTLEKLTYYNSKPLLIKNDHHAAIRALSWSTEDNDLLITGGGTLDRTIKIWNIKEDELIHSIKTEDQICSLIWRNNNEIISSINDFNNFNNKKILIWNYNYNISKTFISKKYYLIGHKKRVLHIAKSPDNNTLISLSSDKTLKFWNLENNIKKENRYYSLENHLNQIR